MRILIFGDSIAQGFFDTQGGWATRIANHYHQQTLQTMEDDIWVDVFNLGISGERIEGLLDRLECEIKARQWKDDPMIVVLADGINDAVLENKAAVTDIYDFQEAYEKVIEKAKKFTDNIVCVGLTGVDEKLTNPWKYSSIETQWLNNRINLFEDTIKQSAARKDIPFVPIHDKFLRMLGQDRNLLADGLHPNDEGHELIASWVKPELERLLRLAST